MLKVWCMFDNHTFAPVTFSDRPSLIKAAGKLIALKRGASFFVRDEYDATINSLHWHSRDTEVGMFKWADAVMVEHSFRKLMVA